MKIKSIKQLVGLFFLAVFASIAFSTSASADVDTDGYHPAVRSSTQGVVRSAEVGIVLGGVEEIGHTTKIWSNGNPTSPESRTRPDWWGDSENASVGYSMINK